MQTPSELLPGALFGRYRIERLLGRGGMGAVYAAEQLDDGRTVALKVLSTTLDTSEDRARFLREGRIAASVNHPNTVYVYRTEEIDGSPTIAMELVDGGTLEDKVTRHGPLPVAEAIRDILAIIDGLEAAHRSGILHRDIKPANCFVSRSGEVKVGDFGLSRPVDRASEVRLTQTGLFLGTPVFSSPEQLLGEALDVRADIYAVGATLYYLLSGKLPYESDNAVRLVAAVLSGAAVPLSTRRPDLPKALDAVVMRCLARSRDDRFADYGALREALEAFQPTVLTPAPIGRRLAAAIVDGFVLSLLTTPAALAIGIDFADMGSVTFRQMLLGSMVALPFYLVWYGVLEGRFGWSPAKYLAGLRVVREDGGGTPGVLRGLARATLYWTPAIVGDIAWGATSAAPLRSTAQICAMYGTMALLFVRARRSNGYASEYDRITRTRVVRRSGGKTFQRSGVVQAVAEPPKLSDTQLGPFAIVDGPGPGGGVVEGYDRELGRPVWIVRRPPGAPPVSATERLSNRAGCLRWLGAQRLQDDGWDAYAAVSGLSLRERVTRDADWATVHHWIDGVVTELEARQKLGWPDAALTVDHVWITADEDAVILPFTTSDPQSPDALTSEHRGSLPRQIAELLLHADHEVVKRFGWPLRSRVMLELMSREPADLGALREGLEASAPHAEGLTARKRMFMGAATIVPALLLGMAIGAAIFYGVMRNPQLNRLAPLLTYLGSERSTAVENRANRELVGYYVAAHFRETITNRNRRPSTTEILIDSAEWRLADSVIAALPTVSPARLSAADSLVDRTWRGRPPRTPLPWEILVIVVSAMALTLPFMAGLITSIVARRGIIMRVLGLDIVTARGAPAGRLRLFWRHLVSWIAPLALWGAGLALLFNGFTPGATVLALITAVGVAAAIYFAWSTPSRGLPERLSGTIVVPE